MKKILSMLAALTLVGTSALSVVSCGPKVETDVLFLLPGKSMSQQSSIRQAYVDVVNDFNKSEEMTNSPVKVKVIWESDNPIERRLSSREQLPDLYIAYPDLVSQYVYNVNTESRVRNLESTYYGDSELPVEENELLKNRFWNQEFYEEGKIDGQLYALPLTKSFEISVLNLRIFLELVSYVDQNLAQELKTKLQPTHQGLTPSELFNPREYIVNEEIKKQLLEPLKAINDGEDINQEIQIFFKNSANVLNLAKVYLELYQTNSFGIDSQDFEDKKKMYSLGIDSSANKVFLEYADKIADADAINPQLRDDFFYSFKQPDFKNQKMDVELDNPKSETFKNIATFYDQLKAMAPYFDSENDPVSKWGGVAHIKGNGPSYSSNYFNEGAMLLTSSSSAGASQFKSRNDNFDKNRDLLTVTTSTMTGQYFNTIPQGPSLAGFKSVGANAHQKEAITTKFVKYLLQPKTLNHLAITSGYIPTTSAAIEIYKHYKNGNFNNKTGEWISEDIKPENGDDYEQIQTKSEAYDQHDEIINQLLNDFVLPNAKNQIHIVGTIANPAGTILRDGIEAALGSYFLSKPGKFSDLLASGQSGASLLYQFRNNLPSGLANSTIKVRQVKS